MANQNRRQTAQAAELERLRTELATLRRATGWIDPAYSSALVDLAEVACLDLRRPDDLGGNITTNGAASRPPSYSTRAMNALWYERRKQRLAAVELRKKLRVIVDDDHDPEDGLQGTQRNMVKTRRSA